MHSYSHLTPRYAYDRLGVLRYQRKCPDHPWLTRQANEILLNYLKPTDAGLEWGSGRSTIWFAKRVGRLTSVEHDRGWFDTVEAVLAGRAIGNVDYLHLVEESDLGQAHTSSYVGVASRIKSESLDFVLVDGILRDYCALAAIGLLKPGGALIIDNVERYLPSGSRSPVARRRSDGAAGPLWEQFSSTVRDWRMIWTSSGVTDTAFFLKPSS